MIIIANSEDLARAQIALIDFGWFHFAVVDKNGCAWLLCEHEDGEMYATCGSEDGWLPALQVVTLHGPLTVLQDLSRDCPGCHPDDMIVCGEEPWLLDQPTFPQRFPPDITVYEDDTLDEPVDPATCPHCCCTYTTECCYCDGSRTPLEDS